MASIIKAADATRTTEAAPFRLSALVRRAAVPRQAGAAPAVALPVEGSPEREPPADAAVRADRLNTLAAALADATAQIQTAKSAWLAHWEQAAVSLAVAIAERVIRGQLDRRPEITLTLIREALELAAGSGDVTLRLHPQDFETMAREAKRLAGELPRLGCVDVAPDADISRGGCRVDTRNGTIDQQLEAQLARIVEELA